MTIRQMDLIHIYFQQTLAYPKKLSFDINVDTKITSKYVDIFS